MTQYLSLAFIRPVLAVLLLALVSACIGPTQEPKKPVVTFEPVSHDVYFSRYTVLPSEREEEALSAFMEESGRNPGGNVALLAASPEEPKTEERLIHLQSWLQARGYREVLVAADPSVPAERIRVSTSQAHVTAPDCPDWTYEYMANYRNTVLSNFGCAHAVNLSKVVADPNDLIAGQGDSTADAERGFGIIESYRTPPPAPAAPGGGLLTGGF